MKRALILTAAGVGVIAVGQLIAASPVVLNSFKTGEPSDIVMPALPDSASAGANRFRTEMLLDSRSNILRGETQNWTTVIPDTAGMISFPKASGNAVMRVMTTDIRPSRFMKGKLKLKSTSMAEVAVNGESKIKKTAVDSVPTEMDAQLSLEPERNYTIVVKVFASPEDVAAPQIGLEFIPDDGFDKIDLAQGPDLKRRFMVENVNLGKRMTGAIVSPDGKYTLLRYSQMFDADYTLYTSNIIETATGKIVGAGMNDVSGWMPKGSILYGTRKLGSGYQLFTIDPKTLRESVLAENLPCNRFDISPDGKYLLYYKEVEGTKETEIMRRVQEPDDRLPGNRDRNYLMKYDLRSGVSSMLVYGGPTTYLSDIAPDGKKIVYMSSKTTPSKYPFYESSVIEMDINTCKTDTLFVTGSSVTGVIYSPDGKSLFVSAGPSAFDGIGQNTKDNVMPNDFDTQGYIFDIASRKAKAMSRDFDPKIDGMTVWNRADGKIYFIAEEGFHHFVYSLDPKSGKFTKIDTGLENVRNFSIGKDEAAWLAATGQSYTYNGRGEMVNLKNGKVRLIDDPMAEDLSKMQLGKSETWTFTAKDGTVIDGTITLPPDFDPNKKYPLIVYYYGGTSPSDRGISHPYSPQLFASRDYVVYVLNPSGTTGYGQDFSARHVNAWGDWTADEIIEGTKKFCDEHPFVDRKKIGCLGASYGGFMTQLLQTKTDIFAAAVSHAGISNVTSYWGEGYWGYSYNSVAAAKSYPWTNPDLFTKHGSLFNADKIHTPLLLLHGTVDTNVPIGESIQLFNALRILGRDVEFITVEGSDHVVTDYVKRRVWQNTIMAWFAKYLQDDPGWWNSLYGK